MAERFLKYETTNPNLPVDHNGVLTTSEPDLIIETVSGEQNTGSIYSISELSVKKCTIDTEKMDSGTFTAVLLNNYLYNDKYRSNVYRSNRFYYSEDSNKIIVNFTLGESALSNVNNAYGIEIHINTSDNSIIQMIKYETKEAVLKASTFVS